MEVLGIAESRPIELAVSEPDDPGEALETDDLSTVSTGIPGFVDFSPLWVASNAGLGMLVLLLLVAAAQLFNDALKNNHDHLVERMSSRSSLLGRARLMLGGLPHPPILVSFALVAAVLGLLADPSVALSITTIGQILGMAIAITCIVGIYDGGASRMIARQTGLAPRFRLYPIAIAVAVGCLAFSRVFDIAPGVLYGLFAGVIFTTAVDLKLEGRAYARSSVMLMAAAIVGYVIHRMVGSAAAEASPSLMVIIIDTAAAVLFVGGLQAVIVQLLPTRYVNGEKIASWSRLGWFLLLAGSLALYLQFVVRPSEGAQNVANLWFVFAFVGFAVVFWVWCTVAHRRRLRAARLDATDDPVDVGV